MHVTDQSSKSLSPAILIFLPKYGTGTEETEDYGSDVDLIRKLALSGFPGMMFGNCMITLNRVGLAPPKTRPFDLNASILKAILVDSFVLIYLLELANYFREGYARSNCNKVELNEVN